ncbi:MAG: glycosyltransferase family 39 protein [Anaerolineaceae bacterium]|nr:glycosyltransferase family 39 protein [Anaerolineaceae bacterium]
MPVFSMRVHNITRRDWLTLLLILFVAGLLRLGQPGIVEFFHDEAMLSSLAQDMVDGKHFPLTGINSSTGIPNPPINVYIMALPYAISSDPQVATIFVMLLNVLGVGLLWLIAHRYFGKTTALIAGLTYAASPWAILYSRKIWAQDFHTPFLLLALFLGLYGFWEAPRRGEGRANRWQITAQALCLPTMLIGMQIHFAAWALVPMYMLLIVMRHRRVRWGALVASALLSALVLLPYGLGLAQTLQDDPTRVSAAAERSTATEGLSFDNASLEAVIALATGYGVETWVAPNQTEDMLAAVPPPALWWIIGGAALLGVGVLLWQASLRPLAPIVLIWALLPPLVLLPQWTPVYIHYFIASIPAYMLLAGISVAWLSRQVPLKQAGRAIILGAYLVILVTQGLWWRGALRYLDQNAIEPPGFSVPLHYLETIRTRLSRYNDVVVLSYGMSWSLHHESVVWPVMWHIQSKCVRTLVPDGYAVFPDGPFAVLKAPDAPNDPVRGLYTSDTPVIYPARPGETPYEVYTFDSAPAWSGPDITSIEPIRFDMGATLTGYALDGGTVYLEWQLADGRDDLNYQYSAQLFAAGERVGQYDTVFWQQRHWCAGDRLLTWGPISGDDTATELQVSLYRIGTGSQAGQFLNANVLDAAGAPSGQYAVIPLK